MAADERYPSELLYHAEHDWVRIDPASPDIATFGITWYAQDSLGEIVFWDGPEVGRQVEQDRSYAELESVKAVSDVIAPLSGEVVEVNPALGEDPATVNASPYDDGWLVRVRIADSAERDALMDADAYRALLG
jgi:glycine cleavage system H protein